MSNKKFISLDNLEIFKQSADSNYADKSSLNALEQTISTKQDTLVSGTNIKTLNNQSLLGAGNIQLENLVEITYADLVSLKTEGNLTPGAYYRITDYVTTTKQSSTRSAEHQFDVIVLALENNKLSEQAYAMLHDGDTYFANCKLEAWQLNYCLDNDVNRFAWADNTNGKGVIYRMIDEFGNDCPYDFKNILFTSSGKYTRAYTFSYTEDSTIKDASLLVDKVCRNNIIKEYINSNQQELNFNVFYSRNTSFNCHFNIFGEMCRDNTFKDNCYYNIFGYYCQSNTFGDHYYYNILGINCYTNTFGNSCYSNILGDSCYKNTFGEGCHHNIFGWDCYSNTFGGGFQSNTFKNHCSHNTFGYYCHANTFGDTCFNNQFGYYCSFNTFGNECGYNTFGDSLSAKSYYSHNIIDDGCKYLYIVGNGTESSSNYLQHVHIHLGVQGTSSSNRKTVSVDRNLPYTTDVLFDEQSSLIIRPASSEVNIAPIYSASSTYAVNDLCIYAGQLYKCTTAISTAEAWDATHWTATSLSAELASQVTNAINGGY